LLEEDVGEVLIFNRTAERARAVARRIGGQKTRVVPLLEDVRSESFDLVVNATRLGLGESDPSPLDFNVLHRVGAAMDVVYGRKPTPFVRAAEALGIRATDGAEMLVQQAAASFECWWGEAAPVEVMRAAMKESQPE
jgi:shikimate dehydrogenase